MGRTVPTYVDQVRQIEEKWAKFRRVLRREDQLHFDRLLRSVRQYSPSGMYQSSDDPRESVVLSILLDLEKRLAVIEENLKLADVNEENPADGKVLFPEDQ
jgi:hypothetical protein